MEIKVGKTKRAAFPARMLWMVAALLVVGACNYHERKVVPRDPALKPDDGGKGGTPPLEATYESIQANILKPMCVTCHSGPGAASGLDLSSYEGTLTSVEPGNPDNSVLYLMVDWEEMPPEGPLTQQEKSVLYQWIAEGAKR